MSKVKNVILSEALKIMPDYPVGRNLGQTMMVASSMANELNKLFMKISRQNIESMFGFQSPHITLFCQGSSGAILAALVAARCCFVKEILHLKKPGEQSHAGSFKKGYPDSLNFFIDDHIASGQTIAMCCRNFLFHNPRQLIHGVIVSSMVFEKDIPENIDYLICGQHDQTHPEETFAG